MELGVLMPVTATQKGPTMQQQQHLVLFEEPPDERFQQLERRAQSAVLELMAALIVQVHRATEQRDQEHHNE